MNIGTTTAWDLEYQTILAQFDDVLCEAIAVSQGAAERWPLPNVAYGTHLFTRMCIHGTALIRAAPRSRWTASDHEFWDFSAVAPQARAIMEGYLSFAYMMEPAETSAEIAARIDVFYLNDCTRRLELFRSLGTAPHQVKAFEKEQLVLRTRLKENPYFAELTPKVRASCLSGQKPWIKSREQLLELGRLERKFFDMIWILCSQHSHVLPMSLTRIEPNGRGTGVVNDADGCYIKLSLEASAMLLEWATDQMVVEFPDVAPLRNGLDSKFSPGPASNRPTAPHSEDRAVVLEDWVDEPKSKLARIVKGLIKVQQRRL